MPPHLLPIAVEDECWYLHNCLQMFRLLDVDASRTRPVRALHTASTLSTTSSSEASNTPATAHAAAWWRHGLCRTWRPR